MIKVKSISKEFKGFKAVDKVSFEVSAGEIFGLLGPNGAGKTTTLRMLATTLKPNGGTAEIAGHDILRQPEAVRSALGVLTAEVGLYGRLTARENVRYFGQLYGINGKRLEDRINEVFKLLEIESFADRKTENFSTGMKQKVAIARAILHDPPVLIFDEPTSGLDVIASQTVINFIKRAQEMGKCIILSTHIMVEAQKLCKRASIIFNGKIIAYDSVANILKKTKQNYMEDAFLALINKNEKN